jgi:hypothetical protein
MRAPIERLRDIREAIGATSGRLVSRPDVAPICAGGQRYVAYGRFTTELEW